MPERYPRLNKVCRYGDSSLKVYRELHHDLQVIFRTALDRGFDHSLICGHRDEATQNELFKLNMTKVRWPDSKHNSLPSMAVDATPWWPGLDDRWVPRHCRFFAGAIAAITVELYLAGSISHVVRWGGDWDRDGDQRDQKFDDLVHFELVKP